MSNSIGSPEQGIYAEFVDPAVRERLLLDVEGVPGIPFAWMLNYKASSALQNIRYFENGVRHCQLEFPIRVFLSNWSAAILVSFVPLEAVKEPHIQEWYDSFYEIAVEEAKTRLAAFPEFPYDGRNPDLALADLRASGELQKVLKRSRARLLKLGVPLLSQG